MFDNSIDKWHRKQELGIDANGSSLIRGKYYKKIYWDDLIIKWSNTRSLWVYISSNQKVGDKVLTSGELIECDKDGNIKEIEMAKKDVNYIGGEYDVVSVSYELEGASITGPWIFKIDKDLKVKEDDLVVVESSKGLGITRVLKRYSNTIENRDKVSQAKAWVVDIVDYSRQQARKDATEKREYILQQLEEKKKSMESILMYEMLAKSDEEAAKLLEDLKSLGN